MIKKRAVSRILLLGMLLGSYKGYGALFDKGASEPKQIFPYAVSSLPAADQEALENGIPVRNHEALDRLLEDYLS